MAMQLPSEVQGTAVGVLIFSIIGLLLNGLVIWLTWVHRERTSYIALISYLLFLSTATCIASQIHFYVDFVDVMTTEWKAALASPNNPEMKISNGAVGVDLVLWYFRQYAFSASSMLVLFWAFALLQSVYGWNAKQKWKVPLSRLNATGKAVSILLPILTICILQSKAIQSSLGTFMFLANVILMISLAFGAILMLAILARYIQSRRELVSRSLDYGHSTGSNSQTAQKQMEARQQASGIYDRWLMTRFSIAFVVLSIFELTNMLFQFAGMNNNDQDAQRTSPNLSADRAKQTTILFMPGPAPSFLLFIVFGTTSPFRRHMYATFVPRRWQRIPDAGEHQTGILLSSQAKSSRSWSVAISSPTSTEQNIRLTELEKGRGGNTNTSDDALPILPNVRPSYYQIPNKGLSTR